MALLKLLVVMMVLVSGCYAPEVSECNVTCTADSECAGGLVCTPQGLCGGTASACDENNATDGGARMIQLRVAVMGEGKVAIGGGPECIPDDDGGPMGDTCTLMVPAGPLVIEAIVDEKPFERWTSIVCAGQPARCEVTLQLDANVTAKFR
jgi:hypothetical protein